MELKEVYNSIAKDWADSKWGERSDWCDDFLTIIASRLGDGEVLDIGCGSGEDCKFFYDHGVKTVGIDFSEKLIEEAKSRFPNGNFIVMDIEKLDFEDFRFGAVVAKHSLLHLPKKNLPTVLKKINNLLKPEGWFLLTLKEGIGEKEVESVRHGHKVRRFFAFYTNFEVKKLLEEAGFELVEEGVCKREEDVSLKFLAQKVKAIT